MNPELVLEIEAAAKEASEFWKQAQKGGVENPRMYISPVKILALITEMRRMEESEQAHIDRLGQLAFALSEVRRLETALSDEKEERELSEAREEAQRFLCPDGCGCAFGTEDADRTDCACGGPCQFFFNTGEYVASLNVDIEQLKLLLRRAVDCIPGSHQTDDLLLRRKASLSKVPKPYDIGEAAEIDAILNARTALGGEGESK